MSSQSVWSSSARKFLSHACVLPQPGLLRSLPRGHDLKMARPLGPSKWAEFSTLLEEVLGPPEGEVLPALLPANHAQQDARVASGLSTYL